MSQSNERPPFQATHLLVSRTRQIPVQLVPTAQGTNLVTEEEWNKGAQPAFSFHPKRGFFCLDVQVLGFSLQPLSFGLERAEEQRKSVSA